MTPSDRLQSVSTALYGSWSPSSLAEDLGVSERSVRRWVAGSHAIPETIWPELRTICLDRADSLMALMGEIDKL